MLKQVPTDDPANTPIYPPEGGHVKSTSLSPWPDRLRNLATVMVIGIHAAAPIAHGEGSDFNSSWWWSGNFWNSLTRPAVPLFVMLSGYLLLGKDYSLPDFLKRRFSRVVIPAIFWMLIYCLYGYLANGSPATIGAALKSLVTGPVHYHLWFIYLIIGLYLVYPILRPWVRTASNQDFLYFFVMWSIGTWIYKALAVFAQMPIGIYFELFSNNCGYFVMGYFLGNRVSMKYEVGSMKYEVGSMKYEVGSMKDDVGSMKDDVGSMKYDVGSMKYDVGSRKDELPNDPGTNKIHHTSYFILHTSYFILHNSIPWLLIVVGTAATMLSSYIINTFFWNGHTNVYFYDYLTPNVAISAIGWFLLAKTAFNSKPLLDIERDFSAASFGIYFAHVLVMDYCGKLGYWHSLAHPIFVAPMLTTMIASLTFLAIALIRVLPGGQRVT